MNQDARGLEDLLDREIEAARLLSTTLAAERTALTGDSPDAVRKLAAEKVQLLETLESLEGKRRELYEAAGLGGAGDASGADALGPAATIAYRWRALMDLIAGCRKANEVNGYIIHVRRNQIRQLMDVIRGGAPGTYGPQGKTVAKALRPLAQA